MMKIPIPAPMIVIAALSSAGASCDRADAERGARPVGSTVQHPPAIDENGAPLANVDGKQPADSNAARGESSVLNLGRHDANAKFVPLHQQALDADARLEQIGGQVQIRVSVREADVGRRRLLLRKDGPCTGRPTRSATPEKVLGELEITDDHTGALVVRVEDANLKPEESRSLLGQALVLTPQGSAQAGPSDALACAQIRAD